MADLTGGSTSPNSGSRRTSRRTSFNLPSRRSTNPRIDEILETARERAENMTPTNASSPHDTTGSPASRQAPWTAQEDSSADENTGLVGSSARKGQRRFDSAASSGPARRSLTTAGSQGESVTQLGDGQEQRPQENGNGASSSRGSVATKERSWGEKALGKFKSVELENKGSVARDHLALERTFLAWLRTSLAFASIGIAVTQLFRLNTSLSGNEPNDGQSHALRHVGKPLGATFLGISILTLILGYRRYLQGQEWIIKGKFPASRGTVIVLVFMSLAIMILSLVVVIVIQPSGDTDL